MGRNSRHSAQIAAANQARSSAVRRLIALYADDYERLYAEEAEKRGVQPRRRLRALSDARSAEQPDPVPITETVTTRRPQIHDADHPLRKAYPSLDISDLE